MYEILRFKNLKILKFNRKAIGSIDFLRMVAQFIKYIIKEDTRLER